MHANCQWLILTPYWSYWLPGSLWTLTGKMGGLVFQPFLDFRVEIFTEDGHFLAISVFIIVTGLKPQNKKQFGVRLYTANCKRRKNQESKGQSVHHTTPCPTPFFFFL